MFWILVSASFVIWDHYPFYSIMFNQLVLLWVLKRNRINGIYLSIYLYFCLSIYQSSIYFFFQGQAHAIVEAGKYKNSGRPADWGMLEWQYESEGSLLAEFLFWGDQVFSIKAFNWLS